MKFETFDAVLEKLGNLKNSLGATERCIDERGASVGWLMWNERAPDHISVWVVSSLLGIDIRYERVYVFDRDTRTVSYGHGQAVTTSPRLENKIETWEEGFQHLVHFLDEYLGKKHDLYALVDEEDAAGKALEARYLGAIKRLRDLSEYVPPPPQAA